MARISAEHLARNLEMAGYAVIKRARREDLSHVAKGDAFERTDHSPGQLVLSSFLHLPAIAWKSGKAPFS